MRISLALGLLVACGSHGTSAGDGGGDDGAGGDASDAFDASIDVPNVRGTVHVQIANAADALCSSGSGVANLHVVFVDVDSTVTDVVTDAGGNAQGDVFPGASVTAVCHRALGACSGSNANCAYTIVTVEDVEPGDNLMLDADAFLTGTQTADATSAGTFKVSYAAHTGATGYTVYYPCGNAATAGTSNVSLAMEVGCATPTMDLVVVANNGAYTEQANVAFTSGGSVTITDTWHPLAAITATYSNAPTLCADSGNVDYPCNVEFDRFVPELHGNRTTTSSAIAGSPVMATIPATPHAATAWIQSILTTEGTNGIPHAQTVTQVIDGTQGAYAVDFATASLPWLCLGATANCPSWDPANPVSIGVPVTGTAAIDLFEVDALYVRGNVQTFYWRAFGPTPGDFVFPPIPASAGPIMPVVNDKKSATHAHACESDAIGGWRPARQNVFDSLETCKASPSPTAKRLPGTLNRLSSVN